MGIVAERLQTKHKDARDWGKIPEPEPTPKPPPDVVFKNLKSLSHNSEKLKFVLCKIHNINKRQLPNVMAWREAVVEACGWTGLTNKAIGIALSQLHKQEFLIEVVDSRGRRIYSQLTAAGKLAAGLDDSILQPNPPPPPISLDARLILNADSFFLLADTGEKLAKLKLEIAEAKETVAAKEREYAKLVADVRAQVGLLELAEKGACVCQPNPG